VGREGRLRNLPIRRTLLQLVSCEEVYASVKKNEHLNRPREVVFCVGVERKFSLYNIPNRSSSQGKKRKQAMNLFVSGHNNKIVTKKQRKHGSKMKQPA
jgi:hypothetical protein